MFHNISDWVLSFNESKTFVNIQNPIQKKWENKRVLQQECRGVVEQAG